MTFQTVPVNITGPTYQDRSRPLSSQETRNFYHEVVESGKDHYVIKSFPGQKLLNASVGLSDRGMFRMKEIAYRVVDKVLYEVNSFGKHTNRGAIDGAERCTFATDGEVLVIVSNGIVHGYNSTTKAVTVATDASIVGALSVSYINSQFIYTFPSLTVFSDVGDWSTASSLNAMNAESDPDNLVRDYVFDQVVYRFGQRSTEGVYNSGVGTPPFARVEGLQFNVGLAAKHSIANTKSFVYWLGSDNNIYRARGGHDQVISTASIVGEINKYSTVSDAFAQTFTIDNLNIYMITFPTGKKTWCLIEEYGDKGWFTLAQGINDGVYNASSILSIYNKTFIGEKQGKLLKLDFDSFDQYGSAWQRRRVLASVNGGIFQQNGKRVQMSRMEFLMETGTGLNPDVQGSDPKLMIEASYDGGRTWTTGAWLKVGRLGEFDIRAEWFSMKSFYDMVVRITTSDPVSLNIYSASIDLRLAGR